MNASTEIDQAGRLVIPKKLRDALHLLPGTRVLLHQDGESLILKADVPENRAYQKQGLWVYHAPESISGQDLRNYLEAGRAERDDRAAGKVLAR